MFTFTQILEISKKLRALGVQDSEMPRYADLQGDEEVVIIQNGKNVRMPLSELSNGSIIIPEGSKFLSIERAYELFVAQNNYITNNTIEQLFI